MEDKVKIVNIETSLDDFLDLVVEKAIAKHIETCQVRKKVDKLELRFAAFVGFMLGSGLLGGAIGGYLVKVIS